MSDACHQQWKDTKVCLSAHARLPQVLLVGSDPRGAHAEAVTSFLEEMCHVEVLALEEISRRLAPARSSSLFSTAVRGTVLSWESAWASALLPQPRHREPLLCPHRWLDPGAGAAQRHRGLPCCSVGTLEDLQLPRPCSLKSSTLPRAEKLRPAEVRE